jgi:hypothetical protein
MNKLHDTSPFTRHSMKLENQGVTAGISWFFKGRIAVVMSYSGDTLHSIALSGNLCRIPVKFEP